MAESKVSRPDRKRLLRGRMRRLRMEPAKEERARLDRELTDTLLKFLGLGKQDQASVEGGVPGHMGMPDPRQAGIYAYVSCREKGEADTLGLLQALWAQDVQVAVPKVEGAFLRFYRILGMEDLEPGNFGILEPKEGCKPVSWPGAPVITPGLAFTPEGARLGYGGGFYDRFFEAEPLHPRAGLAYPFQILPRIPQEACDRRLQAVVTCGHIYRCG